MPEKKKLPFWLANTAYTDQTPLSNQNILLSGFSMTHFFRTLLASELLISTSGELHCFLTLFVSFQTTTFSI